MWSQMYMGIIPRNKFQEGGENMPSPECFTRSIMLTQAFILLFAIGRIRKTGSVGAWF